MDERSLCGGQEDEVARFLRTTEKGDSKIDRLKWWDLNTSRFLCSEKVSSNILAVQASSVSSKSAFFVAGTLISDNRLRLSNEIIQALMCLRLSM